MASTDAAALEAVLKAALSTLYESTVSKPQEKKAADAFLRSFQLTPAALDVCASLLDQSLRNSITESLSSESVPPIFFSAQTLAIKMRREPLTSNFEAGVWAKRIITWLSCDVRLPRVVVTQLLLAFVATLPRLQAQDIKLFDSYGKDKNTCQLYAVVRDFYAQFNGKSVVGYALYHLIKNNATHATLAEFLLLLIEEVDFLAERSARRRMQDEVNAWVSTVLDQLLPQLMHDASNQAGDTYSNRVETQGTVLRALTSWLRYGTISSQVILRNPLLHSLVDFIARDELFDVSIDLAVQLVTSYTHDTVVLQWITPRFLALRGAFHTAAAVDDVSTCLSLCRLFTEMGEACLELVVAGNTDQVRFVDLLLDCMSFTDADVADVTISFWFQLLEMLRRRETLAMEEQLKPRLARLATLSMEKLQFQDDFTRLPIDKQQNIKAFRQEVGDLLRDCCHLLGVDAVLQHCVNELNQACQTPIQARRWEAVEARLYCFRSIAREVEKNTTNALDALISSLFHHLPQFADHPAICYTSCLIVARYAAWLCNHPTSLSILVSFLTTCVTKSAQDAQYGAWEVARAAAAAVRALAIDCWSILGHDIVAFYLQIEQSNGMSVEDQVLILEGICAGVASSKDRAQILSVLDQVMKGIGQRLTALVASSQAISQVHIASNDLLRLLCLYEYLDVIQIPQEKPPLVMLTEQLWPLLNQLLSLYRGHDELVESICRCYKRILRSCGHGITPLVPQLADNLVTFYKAEPKSSYLYTASMVLKFLTPSSSADLDSLFGRLLFTLIEATTPIFASASDMEARPDVIEEFFYLMERAVRCTPQVLTAPLSSDSVSGPLLTRALSFAVSALAIFHNDANKSVLCFLENVYAKSGTGTTLVSLCAVNLAGYEENTKKLVHCLLQGVVLGTMSTSRVDADYGSIAGLLAQIATVHGLELQQWIAEWFEIATAGTFATAAVYFITLDEAQEFQKELFSATSERAFRRTVRHFGKLCASRNTTLTDCER
ncbi:hypothetical protein CCR75_001961 [Bremia lactucae]|uniref:Exportin-1/Importin-beta-like domain-containing protein n=1 Tax=Bremia lactucae TaxID=4779 RepID=A0A976FJ30_BRELC|nr:hypothetical protein CCR75_001961 [Bremia lactucae]